MRLDHQGSDKRTKHWGPEPVPLETEATSTRRSLKVGLQISLDYWWCTNVVLRGVEEVCPGALGTWWWA